MTGGLSCLTEASLCPTLGLCDSSCHSNPKRAAVMRSFGSSDWICVFPEKSSCVGLQSIFVFSSPDQNSHTGGSSTSLQTCKTKKCHCENIMAQNIIHTLYSTGLRTGKTFYSLILNPVDPMCFYKNALSNCSVEGKVTNHSFLFTLLLLFIFLL